VPDDRRQRLAAAPRISPEAQDAYLLARQYWNQRTEEGLRTSIDYFRRAIDREPQFALAHAGLADAYTALGYFSYLWPVDAFKIAETEAQHAIDLDPSAGEPHATMGYIRLYWDWDWRRAEEEFNLALALSPGYANAHEWHSVYLSAMGRLPDAARELEEAKRLDPLSLSIATDAGWQLYLNRQYAPAVASLSQTIARNDRFPLAHLWRGRAYEQLGQWDQAIAEFAKTSEELHDTPVALAQLGHAYAASGRRPDAVRILDRLQALKHAEKTYVTAYGIALIHAGLGEKDAAFDWLATACEERTHWLVWLKLDPRWDGIRADNRFATLLERVHLSD
jgi:tetratricopeptide (TPR) repeat protein